METQPDETAETAGDENSAQRLRAYVWLTLAYLAAGAVGWLIVNLVPDLGPLWGAALADIGATLAVFAFSLAFNNTSFYDPYWSIAPMALVLYWARAPSDPSVAPLRVVLVMTLVLAWGFRLTWNFLRRWRGLGDEDWRYGEMRGFGRVRYWLISLTGLQLMPTIVVFLGMLPVWVVLLQPASPFGVLDVIAFIVCAGGVTIEAVADRQLTSWLKTRPEGEAFCARGLWAWSRHPNYFGELSFWWGLWLFGVASNPSVWWTVAGPVAITALMVGYSVGAMERRMASRRPGYLEARKGVSRLVPLPPRRG